MWTGLSRSRRSACILGSHGRTGEESTSASLHVSTDEVYGSLGPEDPAFSETTPYAPNSPYAASKAASDHFVRAYHHTYGLPMLTTNCSNNYGRFQFPEKLIPLMILNALDGKPLPVYGDGKTFVTGFMSRITAKRSQPCSPEGAWGRHTTSVAGMRSETSKSWRRSATLWMRWQARRGGPRRGSNYIRERPPWT